MSRKANCWDNAVAESSFASLEKDVFLRTRFATKAQARWAVADYIDNFYNPIRKHSYNGQLSPQIAEQLFFQQQDAAYTEFSTPPFRVKSTSERDRALGLRSRHA